jgi:hypothetical protein
MNSTHKQLMPGPNWHASPHTCPRSARSSPDIGLSISSKRGALSNAWALPTRERIQSPLQHLTQTNRIEQPGCRRFDRNVFQTDKIVQHVAKHHLA